MTATFEALVAESAVGQGASPIDERLVADALGRHYGLAGRLTRLATEKDDTFLLDVSRARYLVKVSSRFEDPQLVDLQSGAIDHLAARDASVPVPRLLRTVDDWRDVPLVVDDGPFPGVLRVLSYLPGVPIGSSVPSPAQFRAIGGTIARVQLALRGFEHPRADRALVWDLRQLPVLRPMLGYLPDEARRLVEPVVDRFEEVAGPVLDTLDRQVVHNDVNAGNTLVDPTAPGYVTGLVDFGDVVRTPTVLDLAVAGGSHLGVVPDPWLPGEQLLRGYLLFRDLSETELDVYAVAVPARAMLRLMVAAYTAATDRHRADYLGRHLEESGLARARAAAGVDPAAARARLAVVHDEMARRTAW